MATFNPLESLPKKDITELELIHMQSESPHQAMVKYIEDNCLKGVLLEQGLDHNYYTYALEYVFQQTGGAQHG